jgi:hypothetical protein
VDQEGKEIFLFIFQLCLQDKNSIVIYVILRNCNFFKRRNLNVYRTTIEFLDFMVQLIFILN